MGCKKELMTSRTERDDAVLCGDIYNEKLHLCLGCQKNRFLVIVKDSKTGEEKVIDKFDTDGWINASVDETENIDFKEFCDIVKTWTDNIGDM